jgi:ABC-type transport system substrate-binding protein
MTPRASDTTGWSRRDMLANPHAVAIIAKECVDKFEDLRKPEATVGTGPWMLDSYRPNVGMTLARNPSYFLAGLPYIDRVEIGVDEDNASRMAAFLAGKDDLGWEYTGIINRVDWVQIKDMLKQKRPSTVPISVWDGALKNYAPNLGYDYGGRLMAAWLDR